MSLVQFEKQLAEVKELLQLENYSQAVKRIIDFTLDTENIHYYNETCIFLNWYDTNETSTEVKKKLKELLDKLYEFLQKKEQVPYEAIISIKNLIKKYNATFTLGPINLNINTGEIIGLVGENGNGKTTLLRCLSKELQPTSGDAFFLFNYNSNYDLRTKLVYIPQKTATWRGSMYENLQFTASCYGFKPEENKLVVDLVITRLGLRKYKNYDWNGLSSGYKMRFELARMLLRKPKILLIDEPLANLDILAQQTVLEDFKNIASSPFRPIAIVLSSQQLYEVEKTSNQVVFLKNGMQRNLLEDNLEEKQFIVEFESTTTISDLKNKFAKINLISVVQNGGTLIATFPNQINISLFMQTIVNEQIEINYLRDISNSTRRFFVK
jgi:ABC-2 type transport system ATP-binding protein